MAASPDIVLRVLVAVALIAFIVAMPGPIGALAALAACGVLWQPLSAAKRRRAEQELPTGRLETAQTLLGCATAAAVLLLAALLPVLRTVSEYAMRSSCRNNLKQLGMGLFLYRDNDSENGLPRRDGSDFLIALYTSGVATDPHLFRCPSAREDWNHPIAMGNSLGVSYAALRNSDPPPGLEIFGAGAVETPLACDDSEHAPGRWSLVEQPKAFNHGTAILMLFADGHVEEIGLDEERMRGVTRVGQPGTLLERLSN